MIRYNLKCEKGHVFDSWFKSAEAFDKLVDGDHLSCAVCGANSVSKALMAPPVRAKKAKEAPLTQPHSEAEQKLSELRDHVEKNSTYVGGDFAKVAREMHEGDAPEKSIWGEAKPAEAKALIEEGVPVAPLPFLPKRQAN